MKKLTKKQRENLKEKALDAYENLVHKARKKPNMNHAINIGYDTDVIHGKTVDMQVQVGTLAMLDFWEFIQRLES